LERALVKIGEHLQLPVVQHPGADGGQISAGKHKQHRQALGRANFDGELQDHLLIAGIAAEGEVRHEQVFVDQKAQLTGLAVGELEPVGGFVGDPGADFAMIFQVTFAEIVDQQRQMERSLLFDGAVDIAQSVAA